MCCLLFFQFFLHGYPAQLLLHVHPKRRKSKLKILKLFLGDNQKNFLWGYTSASAGRKDLFEHDDLECFKYCIVIVTVFFLKYRFKKKHVVPGQTSRYVGHWLYPSHPPPSIGSRLTFTDEERAFNSQLMDLKNRELGQARHRTTDF
jgi:hypothetical protein